MEENLLKLSVKELKVIARKSNVNPNLKKVDLVKALLTNLKDIPDQVNDEPDDPQISRRITRSRVSIFQRPSEMNDIVKEATYKDHPCFKDNSNNKKVKRKTGKNVDNVSVCDTFQMFPLISTIQLASKPLIEITNNDVRHENLQDEICTAALTSKRSKRKNVESSKNTEASKTSTVVNYGVTAERDEVFICELNNVSSLGRKISISQDIKRESKRKTKKLFSRRRCFQSKPVPIKTNK